MSDFIVCIDWSEVHDGKLDQLRVAMKGLVEFVEANESRPLAYHVYFSADGKKMTVLQMHPDAASMEYHMRVAAAEFAKVKDLLSLSAIDIYGSPSDALLAQLQKKAELLGGEGVAVHEFHAGFTRVSADEDGDPR
jgi:hypothetical protein